jgi:hypothetical protein
MVTQKRADAEKILEIFLKKKPIYCTRDDPFQEALDNYKLLRDQFTKLKEHPED